MTVNPRGGRLARVSCSILISVCLVFGTTLPPISRICGGGVAYAKQFQAVTFDNKPNDLGTNGHYTVIAHSDGDGTISYYSSNPQIATINPTTGFVTAGSIEGTTLIFAVASETATCNPGEDCFTLTVRDKSTGTKIGLITLSVIASYLAYTSGSDIPIDMVIDAVFGTDFSNITGLNTCINNMADLAQTNPYSLTSPEGFIQTLTNLGVDTTRLTGNGSGGGYGQCSYGIPCPYCGSVDTSNCDWGFGGVYNPAVWGCYCCGMMWL